VQLDVGRTIDPLCCPNETFELYSVPSHENGLPELLAGNQIGSAKQTVEPDVVLLCKINPRINRVWVVGNHSSQRKIASSEWIPFFPLASLEPRFLAYFLRQNTVRDFLAANASGVGGSLMRVRAATFRDFPFPLAPFAEQERIADALDELLSELDAGVAALKLARHKLKLYRASVLKAAVEGALTAEWRKQHPHTEPASELLKRILSERRRRWEQEQLRKFKEKGCQPPKDWKAKYNEPVAPDTTDLPSLPEGWCWATIEQLIRESLRNGHSARAVTSGTGVPTFSLSAVTNGDFSDVNVKQTAADPKKVRDLWVETDDIFVERSNTPELVGTTRRYKGESRRAIFPDLLIRVRVAESITAAYVELALQCSRCRAYFQKSAQGISGSMPKIDQDTVGRAAVPLPSIAEQDAIVEAVEDQLSTIDHLESDLDAKLKNAQALRQSILRQAFSGRLVPQDLKDEPASELLKRIAAERERRVREAAAAKRLNGHKPRRALKRRGKAAPTRTKETDHGRIADR
jgi:type I restriction enzyme S subunit